MKFEYPNSKNGNSSIGGHYPVGAMNTWHGGIHVEGKLVKIKAIADGELIAYKISSDHLTVKDDKDVIISRYSDSFMLIRHKYEYEYGKDKVFTFYSMYNHLQVKSEITPEKCPSIFNKFKKIKVDNSGSLDFKGCILRGTNNDNGATLGIIKQGAEVEILEQSSDWSRINTTDLWEEDSNSPTTKTYKKKEGEVEGWCKHLDIYIKPEYDSVKSDRIIPIKAGDIIGYSGKLESSEGSKYSSYNAAHVEIFTMDSVHDFFTNMNQKNIHSTRVYKKNGSLNSQYERVAASDSNISPYDWAGFGFEIYDSDPTSYFLDSKKSLLQDVLKIVDTNDPDSKGIVTEAELDEAMKKPALRDLLSKMICVHHSEWAYSGQDMLDLKNAASLVYDDIIKLADPPSNEATLVYKDIANKNIERFGNKVESLSHLRYLTRYFSSFKFAYFHPIAFIDQMIRIHSLATQENIIVIGTKQDEDIRIEIIHNPSNTKMNFVHHAIRKVRLNKELKWTILICSEGYEKQLSKIEEIFLNIKNHSGEQVVLLFKQIDSSDEIVEYINNRGEQNQVRRLLFYSHGTVNDGIELWYDDARWFYDEGAFDKTTVGKLREEAFSSDALIYSFACRTGIGNPDIASSAYDNGKKHPIRSTESLAQALADATNATVYAYLRRTDFKNTLFLPDEYDFIDAYQAYKGIIDERERGGYTHIVAGYTLTLAEEKRGKKLNDFHKEVHNNKDNIVGFAILYPEGARYPITPGRSPTGVDDDMKTYRRIKK